MKHVEDETLLDRLAHGVKVKRMREAVRAGRAKTLKRDITRRDREGEVADVHLRAALALVFCDQVFDLIGCPGVFVAAEGIAQRLGALAGLRAMRLVFYCKSSQPQPSEV
ncbi:hypothetical protein AGR7B_Lc100022 [Agrobacterium deltaense RV3]|nr:hypothetical protein AGR7B_Lc100022 [Agrobacterium deltaense RV3]